MGREAEDDNVVLLVVYFEGVRQMTLVAVQDKYPLDTLSSLIYILVEVFNPFQAYIIVYLAICRSSNRLGVWDAVVCIPGRKVVFALDDQHWRYYKPVCIHVFDRNRSFSVTKLKFLCSAFP